MCIRDRVILNTYKIKMAGNNNESTVIDFNESDISNSLEKPVSYTHLDVYKRQI